jgi:hypothetical protein
MKAPDYFFEPMDEEDAPQIAARHPQEVHDMVNGPGSYPERDAVYVDLGLRRDLTGEGLGPGFLPAGLGFARRCSGLRRAEVFTQSTNGGEYSFLPMTREA